MSEVGPEWPRKAKRLFVLAVVISLVGGAVIGYELDKAFSPSPVVCAPGSGGCRVQTSSTIIAQDTRTVTTTVISTMIVNDNLDALGMIVKQIWYPFPSWFSIASSQPLSNLEGGLATVYNYGNHATERVNFVRFYATSETNTTIIFQSYQYHDWWVFQNGKLYNSALHFTGGNWYASMTGFFQGNVTMIFLLRS